MVQQVKDPVSLLWREWIPAPGITSCLGHLSPSKGRKRGREKGRKEKERKEGRKEGRGRKGYLSRQSRGGDKYPHFAWV